MEFSEREYIIIVALARSLGAKGSDSEIFDRFFEEIKKTQERGLNTSRPYSG